MRLNLPVFEQLEGCQNILLAGMGGGFDVFCGLPIYFELQERGYSVHLASLTSSSLKRLKGAYRLSPSLVGIRADTASYTPYFPELHLAGWFKQQTQNVTIWCFEKTGVQPLLKNYATLINHLAIDAIILVDGGVDSLICGDEAEMGSPLEDTISLAAVSQLPPSIIRLSACLGLGAELEISYSNVLENIAALTRTAAYLGSCSLLPQMNGYQRYQAAVRYVQSQPRQDASVINSSIISAVEGNYGDYHLTEKTRGKQLWISPLMTMYWFFELEALSKHNLFLPEILHTRTLEEAWTIISSIRQNTFKRQSTGIPLS